MIERWNIDTSCGTTAMGREASCVTRAISLAVDQDAPACTS